METHHRLMIADARDLSRVDSGSVDLVVTSPPYPMIEMWDDLFVSLRPGIRDALDAGDGEACFQAMHRELDTVWRELYRVVREGGILCINVGDATRSLGESFRLYSNHARIISACTACGFQMLPEILWRKQTNAPNKFIGSGTLPPGAYVTLEHEWILIFRKSAPRVFPTAEARRNRRESAYFWEERNIWFSDVWDFKGVRQHLSTEGVGGGRSRAANGARSRSAAFPFELAYRLINMFSVKGDWVLDPFAGCGTTVLAAMCAGRNSTAVEIEENLIPLLQAQASDIVPTGNRRILERLERHRLFIEECRRNGRELKYTNRHYGFPVVSRQEREILINYLSSLTSTADLHWRIAYSSEPGLTLRL
ncbi:MAG: site-specific DNA-methyltransferase [Spirochaetaceae bacterium]|nr:MAG: site-specific DNA-methyltransferase [Spirochaetaceae bacterium]